MARCVEVQFVYQYVRECWEQGRDALYEDIKERLHIDVTTNRHWLTSALAIALSDHGYAFMNIPGKGYKPVKDGVYKVIESNRISKARNQINRFRHELDSVGLDGSIESIAANNKCAFLEAAIDQQTMQQIKEASTRRTNAIDWKEEMKKTAAILRAENFG